LEESPKKAEAAAKADLEKAINGNAYFSRYDEMGENARRTALFKLFRDIIEYCRKYWFASPRQSQAWYKQYQNEIAEAFQKCFEKRKVDSEKGIPLYYIKKTIKNTIISAKQKETKRRAFEVMESELETEEGKMVSPFDIAKSKKNDPTGQDFDQNGQPLYYLEIINKTYKNCPEKIKPQLQKYITLELLDPLLEFGKRNMLGDEGRFDFIDYKMLEEQSQSKKPPSRKELAASFRSKKGNPITESAAKKTLDNFFEKVRDNLKTAGEFQYR
jgi:hypothetical protein